MNVQTRGEQMLALRRARMAAAPAFLRGGFRRSSSAEPPGRSLPSSCGGRLGPEAKPPCLLEQQFAHQVDFGTVEEATALMKTPAFAENPVGVMYDPDAPLARAVLARFEAGVDEDAMLAQRVGPHSPIPVAHGLS